LRRVLVLTALIALAALAQPGAAGAAVRPHHEDTIVVVAGDVDVPRGETVDGIVVVSGDVRLAGRSDGDVVVLSGEAVVSGRIDGDLVLASGRGHVLPGAFVSGDIRYGDERPLVAGRARVLGDVTGEDWEDAVDVLPLVGAVSWWLSVTFSTALLGLLLLLIGPRAAEALQARAGQRAGPPIAIGLAIFICLPLAAVLAGVTLLGLPLAGLILLSLLPVYAFGYVAGAWALGRRRVEPPRNRFLAFLAGLAVLRVLALIPVLGLLVGLAATIFGLGLIGGAIGGSQERRGDPAAARSPGS
jgi:hypothetical protein